MSCSALASPAADACQCLFRATRICSSCTDRSGCGFAFMFIYLVECGSPAAAFPCNPPGQMNKQPKTGSSPDSKLRSLCATPTNIRKRPVCPRRPPVVPDALCLLMAALRFVRSGRKRVKSIVSAFGRTTLWAKTVLL